MFVGSVSLRLSGSPEIVVTKWISKACSRRSSIVILRQWRAGLPHGAFRTGKAISFSPSVKTGGPFFLQLADRRFTLQPSTIGCCQQAHQSSIRSSQPGDCSRRQARSDFGSRFELPTPPLHHSIGLPTLASALLADLTRKKHASAPTPTCPERTDPTGTRTPVFRMRT